MNPRIKFIAAAGAVLVILAGIALLRPDATTAAEKGALLINLTAGGEDLHKATMALQLANHAIDDGREVVLFLNVRAPVFASQDCPRGLSFGPNPPVSEMLAKLIGRGAKVHVCPHCMEAVGLTAGDLVDGAIVTNREKLFANLRAGTYTFSY